MPVWMDSITFSRDVPMPSASRCWSSLTLCVCVKNKDLRKHRTRELVDTLRLHPIAPAISPGRREPDIKKPWIRTTPTSLRENMKSIISDFTRSVKLSEMKQSDTQLLHAMSHTPVQPRQAQSLQQSDHSLARDIVITDMSMRISYLKRKMAAEQQKHRKEIIDVEDNLKDLTAREIELRAQNTYLREAIHDGRMGDKIDVARFEEMYAHVVREFVSSSDEDEEGFGDSEKQNVAGCTSPTPPGSPIRLHRNVCQECHLTLA